MQRTKPEKFDQDILARVSWPEQVNPGSRPQEERHPALPQPYLLSLPNLRISTTERRQLTRCLEGNLHWNSGRELPSYSSHAAV